MDFGKQDNTVGSQGRSRSKQTVLHVDHGEVDPRRSRVVREARARLGWPEPGEEPEWKRILDSRPEGGTRIEVR